ncbi:hypothetical protein IJS77_03505 [bacterium]|nr:hypothetical protein [bacterium]
MINTVMEKTDTSNHIKSYNTMFHTEKNDNIGLEALVEKSSAPASHKRIADNYMFIKKLYGTLTIYSNITVEEKNLLAKFDFAPLEYSTANQIKEEIEFLKKWSSSHDDNMSNTADRILEIRVKELRNITSNRYVFVTNEIYSGFNTLEQYLEDISKYND